MKQTDPPWPSLLAFEAVVRLGSMTAAARELGTTQPAVSQRVRQLEERLGLPLLDRSQRRPRVNRHGQAYYDEIAGPLRRIAGATQRLRSRASAQGRELMIAVHFGFAHLWLLPRLPRLEAAFPGTRFEIFPVDRDDVPEIERADLAIRFGRFGDRTEHEWPLFPEVVSPVCSPGFAAAHGLGDRLDAGTLETAPLLHMDDHDPRWLDWPRWCERAGFRPPASGARFHYNNYPLLLNAATEGRGLALGWHGLADALIDEGTLVGLGPRVQRTERGYLLGARHAGAAAIAPIVDWFRREVARDAGPSDTA